MRKQAVLLAIFSIVFNSLFSQTLVNSKISSQGGVSSSEGINIEWTLGENLIETVSISSQIFTQGFLQPFTNSFNRNEFQTKYDQIRIFPNPVYSTLNVLFQEKNLVPITFELYDTSGRQINSLNVSDSISEASINVLGLSSGIYTLKISNVNGEFVKIFRVVKL